MNAHTKGISECGDFGIVETKIYDADGACIGVEKNNQVETWFEPYKTPLFGQKLFCRYTGELLLFTPQYEVDTNCLGFQKKETQAIEERYLLLEELIESSHQEDAEKIWQMLNSEDAEIRQTALTIINFFQS